MITNKCPYCNRVFSEPVLKMHMKRCKDLPKKEEPKGIKREDLVKMPKKVEEPEEIKKEESINSADFAYLDDLGIKELREMAKNLQVKKVPTTKKGLIKEIKEILEKENK